LLRLLKKSDKPPRPDALVGTPLLGKEGKVLIYSTIFLLLFKEEYPDRSVRGRWFAF
jgi:hypothetical protein